MKKEWISAFVDSELGEKESEQLQNENGHQMKELVNVYRIIGESIQYKQSQIRPGDQFQVRLKQALQKEYTGLPVQSTKESDFQSVSVRDGKPVKEESVI